MLMLMLMLMPAILYGWDKEKEGQWEKCKVPSLRESEPLGHAPIRKVLHSPLLLSTPGRKLTNDSRR